MYAITWFDGEPDQLDKLEINSIDHIVIQAVDVPQSIRFYSEILGMTHSEFQPPTGGQCAIPSILGRRRSIYMMPDHLFRHMPEIQLRVVLIYALLPNNRLATGSNILPIVEY